MSQEKRLHLRERIYEDTNGKVKRQFIDDDGVVIEEYTLEERWVKADQFVFVGDRDYTEEYGEERSLGRNPEHIKLYRTNIQHVLAHEKLSKDARCAFLSCVAYLDWNSNFVVNPKTGEPLSGRELADLSDFNKDLMAKGLRELRQKGIVAVMMSGSKGNAQHYVVHPSIAWKGKRVAKDMAQIKHFAKNGLELPVNVKYSEGPKAD
ncbi:hypothetical protein WD019_02440 [Fictibacillus sp. Mic-4]|uniref:hypothetical protein n=1 Tax=Fictibacillus sp. Mic-4 TaxID=3132826 RepID=UPI003CEF2AC3